VPLSGMGIDDLLRICRHLEIEPEAWLQGVLGNLARRIERMQNSYEVAVRNEPKREAREERQEEWMKKRRRENGGAGS